MGTGIFSTTIWLNVTSIFAIIYAFYICSISDNKLIKGSPTTIFPIIITVLTILYIGTRPIWCYADTQLYTTMFKMVQNGEWASFPNEEVEPS